MSSPTPLSWQTVTVFISSTFNDMHAERDYLVKRVFPELREWCEQRKLRLIDIDLRWGVTEADATSKNTVKVCLSQIDKARPFFLCFLGQRRGWVPSRNEIDPETCRLFPDLKGYVGAASVTEMEILHAVVNPLNDSAHAEHAFFYHRDPSCLKDLPADPPFLRNTYTNEGIEDPEAQAKADADHRSWLEETIPQTGRPLHRYSARWSPEQRTPELALPLQCPSLLPENQERWREQWRGAGIEPRSLDLTEYPELERQARSFNDRVTAGRLTNFRCGDEKLAIVILQDLQRAISERYPDRDGILPETPLQKELDQQGQFLELNSTGFIERTGDFDTLDRYVDSDSQDLFVLTAPAGMGKTMLLSNWIKRFQNRRGHERPVFYRFIGASDGSTTVDAVLRSLLTEIKSAGYLTDDIPVDPQELRNKLGNLLKSIGEKHPIVLVIDALNQLESGLTDNTWIPRKLPDRVKLIVSFKREGDEAEQLARHFRDVVPDTCAEVKPFQSLDDRKSLVDAYLDQYLKQLDYAHVQALITSPGAENPLFLKVVLSELRVFGSFGNLGQKIQKDFGSTPQSAFDAVLRRLETDPAFTAIPFDKAVPLLFGLLSHARVGLSEQDLMRLFDQEQVGPSEVARQETVRLLLRQVRPFIATRDGRFDFFYDSFRLAAVARYEGTNRQQGQCSSQDWHRSLAGYFESLPTWISQDDMLPTLRHSSELPYHLAWAGRADHLAELMLEDDLLEAVVYGLGPREAIRDLEYARAPLVPPSKELSQESMTALPILQGALRLSQHVLAPHPEELPSQLYGRLVGCGNQIIDQLLEGMRARTRRPWLRPVTASLTVPGGPLIRTLVGHTSVVDEVVVMPDGRRAVSRSMDRTLKIWDLESGRELHTLAGHTSLIWSVAVTSDGRQAISGSSDRTLKVWDLESGQELHTLTGHTDTVWSVVVTADGSRAVSGSDDGTLRVWDLESGQEIASLDGNFKGDLVLFGTPEGYRVIYEAGANTLKVWDLADGRELLTLTGHIDRVGAIVVTPDGRRAVSGSYDKTLKVWDLETGRELATLAGHTSWITAVVVTPDGTTIVSGSDDGTVKVWDLATAREKHTLAGHTDSVTAVAVTPDGCTVVSGSSDNTLKVWDLESGRELATLVAHSNGVYAVAVTPDGRTIVSGSGDNTVKVWNLESCRECVSLAGRTRRVTAVVITSNGSLAVSGSGDHDYALNVWDVLSGKEIFGLAGHTGRINTVVVTPDGRRAISGSYDQTLKVWDLVSAKELYTLDCHDEWDRALARKKSMNIYAVPLGIMAVTVTPDGNRVVSGAEDGTLKIWDLESGQILNTLTGHTDAVTAVAVTPDGKTIVSGSDDNTVKVWDFEDGQVLHTLRGHTDWINAVAVTSDGRRAISGSKDSTLKVWDLESGRELHTLDCHEGQDRGRAMNPFIDNPGIRAVAVTPDGRQAVSGAGDETLKVWDLGSGREFTTLIGHTDLVWAVGVTPDGRRAISGSKDSTLKVWDLALGFHLASYSADGNFNAVAISDTTNSIIAVDELGILHFLRIENVPFGPRIVTGQRDGRGGPVTVQCPYCGDRKIVGDDELGTVVSCQSCTRPLQLNPFVVEMPAERPSHGTLLSRLRDLFS